MQRATAVQGYRKRVGTRELTLEFVDAVTATDDGGDRSGGDENGGEASIGAR